MSDPQWRIRQGFPDLDERTQERLRIYHVELIRWTKRINLISASSVDDADLVHFADGILGAKIVLADLPGDTKEIWDLGSGNGIPGAILSILRPDLGVICVDSDERKIGFLRTLSLRLELDSLAARLSRVEKIPDRAISVATARGFASISKTLRWARAAVSVGGRLYHFKGPEWPVEMKDVVLGDANAWETQQIGNYHLHFEGLSDEKSPARVILRSVRK